MSNATSLYVWDLSHSINYNHGPFPQPRSGQRTLQLAQKVRRKDPTPGRQLGLLQGSGEGELDEYGAMGDSKTLQFCNRNSYRPLAQASSTPNLHPPAGAEKRSFFMKRELAKQDSNFLKKTSISRNPEKKYEGIRAQRYNKLFNQVQGFSQDPEPGVIIYKQPEDRLEHRYGSVDQLLQRNDRQLYRVQIQSSTQEPTRSLPPVRSRNQVVLPTIQNKQTSLESRPGVSQLEVVPQQFRTRQNQPSFPPPSDASSVKNSALAREPEAQSQMRTPSLAREESPIQLSFQAPMKPDTKSMIQLKGLSAQSTNNHILVEQPESMKASSPSKREEPVFAAGLTASVVTPVKRSEVLTMKHSELSQTPLRKSIEFAKNNAEVTRAKNQARLLKIKNQKAKEDLELALKLIHRLKDKSKEKELELKFLDKYGLIKEAPQPEQKPPLPPPSHTSLVFSHQTEPQPSYQKSQDPSPQQSKPEPLSFNRLSSKTKTSDSPKVNSSRQENSDVSSTMAHRQRQPQIIIDDINSAKYSPRRSEVNPVKRFSSITGALDKHNTLQSAELETKHPVIEADPPRQMAEVVTENSVSDMNDFPSAVLNYQAPSYCKKYYLENEQPSKALEIVSEAKPLTKISEENEDTPADSSQMKSLKGSILQRQPSKKSIDSPQRQADLGLPPLLKPKAPKRYSLKSPRIPRKLLRVDDQVHSHGNVVNFQVDSKNSFGDEKEPHSSEVTNKLSSMSDLNIPKKEIQIAIDRDLQDPEKSIAIHSQEESSRLSRQLSNERSQPVSEQKRNEKNKEDIKNVLSGLFGGGKLKKKDEEEVLLPPRLSTNDPFNLIDIEEKPPLLTPKNLKVAAEESYEFKDTAQAMQEESPPKSIKENDPPSGNVFGLAHCKSTNPIIFQSLNPRNSRRLNSRLDLDRDLDGNLQEETKEPLEGIVKRQASMTPLGLVSRTKFLKPTSNFFFSPKEQQLMMERQFEDELKKRKQEEQESNMNLSKVEEDLIKIENGQKIKFKGSQNAKELNIFVTNMQNRLKMRGYQRKVTRYKVHESLASTTKKRLNEDDKMRYTMKKKWMDVREKAIRSTLGEHSAKRVGETSSMKSLKRKDESAKHLAESSLI